MITTNSEYIRVLKASLREQDLIEFSSRFETDVMWLSYESVSDFFQYYHWRAGTLVRALVYGCDDQGTWERVEGQAEAWERQYFFNRKELASLLEDEEDLDEDDDPMPDAEKQRLEQFWEAGELVVGEFYPILSAQSCAFYIATYYPFPGWDVERPAQGRNS